MTGKYSEPPGGRSLASGSGGPSRRPRFWRAALALLTVAALAAAACSRREAATAPRNAPDEAPRKAEARAARPSPDGEEKRPEKGAAGPGKAAPAAKPAPPRLNLAASTRAFGLGSPGLALLPEDFALGPLQDYRSPDKPRAAVLAAAKRFLEGLAAGKLDPALLVPDSRAALALLLAPRAPAAGAADPAQAGGARAWAYRLGRIDLAEGGASASLRVRLPTAAGEERIEGSLALGLVEGEWYVEALSLDPPPEGGAYGQLSYDPRRPGTP